MSVYQMVSLRPNKLFPDPMNNDCVVKLRLTSTLSIACTGGSLNNRGSAVYPLHTPLQMSSRVGRVALPPLAMRADPSTAGDHVFYKTKPGQSVD